MNRRRFLASGVSAASTLALSRPLVARESAGKRSAPSDRISLGFIGLGGMGKGTLSGMLQQPDVEVRAVCDVYKPHLEEAAKVCNGKAEAYADFRRLLDRQDIDGVVISTPDHWHGPLTVLACKAGKHVYVEKPLCHSISEGWAMIEAARTHSRVTQMGIQIHAGENYHRVVDIVRSGVLGKIHKVRVWVSRPYTGLGRPADKEPPPGLDWEMWLGPAPQRRFNKNLFPFHWRWFWAFGNGFLGDMGCHVIDLVHWAMQVEAPSSVTASGGKLVADDNTETPDTLEVIYEYPGFLMTWSSTTASSRGPENKSLGILFHGTNGYLVADYASHQLFDERGRPVPSPKIDKPIARSPGHHRDWLTNIKSGGRCTADVEYGHRLTTVCLLGNIALHAGRKLQWDGKAERFVNDAEADKRLTKEYRKPWAV